MFPFVVILFLLAQFHYCTCASYNIDDSRGTERRFDGIGGLSGGGATSKLLVNYPAQQRNEILDYLFKPNFGASLQILKVEIGGDAQSTEGTEASHMHNSWDENYQRGYEWWLMTEAKKRNPDILLYGLPWTWPGWIGAGSNDPYKNPDVAADYIVRWVKGAKSQHNLTIDYIGIWNEKPYDITYIKTLRSMLDKNQLSHVRIVASDSGWEIAGDILKDDQLSKAVDYIGVHYPGTTSTSDAVKTTKQLWSSEDYSTFNDVTGAGCWARILNQNYVNGYMTSTISWNLIASYYNALPFPGCGLMTANSPWSGHYDVKSPIWITAHTTQFTAPGWSYLPHGNGVQKLEGGGSIVSFVGQDSQQLTVVIETMSHDHSVCIRPPLPPYSTSAQNVTLQLKGKLSSIKQLNIWYSKLGFGGTNSTLFQKLKPVQVVNGMVTLALGIDEVYTLTTLTSGVKGTYPAPPADKPFPVIYKEDFEGYPLHAEPYLLTPQTGSYETQRGDGNHGNVLRQMVLEMPVHWCNLEKIDRSYSLIGNYNWSDVAVSLQATVGPVNGTTGVFVAARVKHGGCNAWLTSGIFFYLFPDKKEYILTTDLLKLIRLKEGKANSAVTGWNNMTLIVEGNRASGILNNEKLFNITIPGKVENGFVGIGTDSFGLADFDNVEIRAKLEKSLQELRKKQMRDSNTLYFESAMNKNRLHKPDIL